MHTGEPLPAVGEVLAALATGVWHWDTATGLVSADAEAARLPGLPAEPVSLTEGQVRARLHPVGWNEITGVIQRAGAEGSIAEVRIHIMDGHGRAVRVVRSRAKPSFDRTRRTYEVTGTLQEVTDPAPGTLTGRSAVTGDWRRPAPDPPHDADGRAGRARADRWGPAATA